MADDFSLFTDSDDDEAVEDLLSQAMDHAVLEQIAAINCPPSDALPSHLEARFRKLKSLPAGGGGGGGFRFAPSKSKSFTIDSKNLDESLLGFRDSQSFKKSDGEKRLSSKSRSDCSNRDPKFAKSLFDSSNEDRKSCKSPADSSIGDPKLCKFMSDSSNEDPKLCKSRSDSSNEDPKLRKSRSDSSIEDPKLAKSPLDFSTEYPKSRKSSADSWNSGSDSPSPPRIGCLWCSPKKPKTKKGQENRQSSSYWSKDDEIFSFSSKEQKKLMKKAMKDEEKINKEAEKIVKWAKQASARMMDVSELDDDPCDFENRRKR